MKKIGLLILLLSATLVISSVYLSHFAYCQKEDVEVLSVQGTVTDSPSIVEGEIAPVAEIADAKAEDIVEEDIEAEVEEGIDIDILETDTDAVTTASPKCDAEKPVSE